MDFSKIKCDCNEYFDKNEFKEHSSLCPAFSQMHKKFDSGISELIIANKNESIEELTKIEKEKDEGEIKLKQDIEKQNNNSYKDVADLKFNQDEIRKELITNKLDVNSKMELYQAAVKGELSEFKKLINRGFPLLEEISVAKYYWTPLHYAMHYGKMEIAFFILDTLKESGKFKMAMALESNDNRTPVLCLLMSSSLSLSDKKEYFTELVKRYQINCNDDTLREIKKSNLEEIYKKYQGK